jgi:hypothetical protein
MLVQALSLSSETAADILKKDEYCDIYEEVFNQENFYFWRMTANGSVELVLVFRDIEDFDRSLEAQVVFDYRLHKDRFFFVVWTLSDPIHPLGFPIGFSTTVENDRLALAQLFQQSEIVVHFLSLLDDELLHIYTQFFDFTQEEKQRANAEYQVKASRSEIIEKKNNSYLIRDGSTLKDQQLSETGLGYLLDFSSLKNKANEESAKEKLMAAILTAVEMFKNHPRTEVRNSSFIVWVGEKREENTNGDAAILLEFYMTPPLNEFVDVVSDDQTRENPLSTVLLAFPEFLTTLEARPVDRGAYPLLQYKSQSIWHLEPNDKLESRLAALSGGRPNPYAEKQEDTHG